MWDGTPRAQQIKHAHSDFNPPIPCGMGLQHCRMLLEPCEFQSTHPVWDGTGALSRAPCAISDFNPPIPCGMGRRAVLQQARQSTISIHPSRVGWDCAVLSLVRVAGISIHPSRVGWDLTSASVGRRGYPFQSTHPVWDGTQVTRQRQHHAAISIHPSRVGWDSDRSLVKPLVV